MKKNFFYLFCIVLISCNLILIQESIAAFPEKRVVIIIPAPPGGGYDAYAKALAPYLQKNLPNNVDIIIKHMPGAGMVRAATAVYKAKPDGYTIGYFSIPGMVIKQKMEKTTYDLQKITWIGRNDVGPWVVSAAKNAPFNTIAEMQKSKTPIRFASESVGTSNFIMCTLVPKLMNIPYRPVTAYKGSGECIVALMRGDGDVNIFPLSTMHPYFSSGDLKPILLLDKERSSLIPDTQTSAEIGFPELVNLSLNRLIGGPPNMPDDRVKTLEEAIIKSENEPELKKWSEKSERFYHPMTAKETKYFIDTLFGQMDKYVTIINEAIKEQQ